VESNPFPELGLKIASFKLLLPSPSALTVIDSPSWWTPSRVFAVACGLAIILVIATAWISSLRRQVELRTSQLKAEVEQHKLTESRLAEQTARLESEIEERKKIEAKVEEGHKQLVRSSHLAGMAEVATSVLHNVGNVLNSSNMLASVLAEQVHNSKVPTLVKTVNLLHEHRDNLADYLTNDERGRHIPLLLEQLSNHLEQDRSRSLERVDALAESVHHIREIVAMQQKYARLSTQTETVEVTEVVEDALRMSSGSFSRNGIEIIREYQQGLLATVDRHKILQILFNLLENARYACVEAGLAHRQVKVKVYLSKSNRISISVTDNGIGIASENLSRLFSQGFFMRKEGHGFGLHSSALAAQDIGGVLEAQSAGAGLGASFTLNFPPKPPTA
jgi:C4-dicarboxylate-specific signal transduction histidine kinase